MTIAICLKVGDGVVLGTDSASSLIGENGEYFNVYNTAEKTINLVRGLPVGLMTYGLGSLAGLSIGSLTRDLRRRLSGLDPDHPEWRLDPERYTMEEIASRVREFFYEELYTIDFPPPVPLDERQRADGEDPPEETRAEREQPPAGERLRGILSWDSSLLGFLAGTTILKSGPWAWTPREDAPPLSCGTPVTAQV
ncbi:MAG TPA: hypothetical protein VFQ45_02640 [Longimicrobium sp.]|nr:hypothetical protein [Longimicrobium sp.]